MVARVATRALDALLRDSPACRGTPAIAVSAFFNALLGGGASAPESSQDGGADAGAPAESASKIKRKKRAAAAASKASESAANESATAAAAAPASASAAAAAAAATQVSLVPKVAYPASDTTPAPDAARAEHRGLGGPLALEGLGGRAR